ncbi:MAG: tetratricopeptide repeat protein [Nitrospina sp.]|nr:tetratricopeptide repeat protein [Nitrospina sp.]
MNFFAERNSLYSKIACLFILIFLSSIVYFNSLQGAFQFDDRNLLNREWITNLNSFNKNVDLKSYQNRPILLWTFAVNNHLNNQHTFGFHLANLTLHTLVAVLIFVLVIRAKYLIPKEYNSKEEENLKSVNHLRTSVLFFPLATSLIFILHPINTDSVTYISSRSSLLATFFYLLTIYFFTETLLNFRTIKYRIILGLLTILGIYLAVASKLIAVTLPVVLIFLFFVIYIPKYFPNYAKYFTISKIILFFGCGGFVLIYLAYLLDILYLPKDQGVELYGRIPYLLVQSKVVIFYYLTKFIFPFNLNVDSGFPFTEYTTDWKIFFSIFLITSIAWLVLKWGNIWVKLGSAWFFLSIAPTSSIIPLNDLAVEHRMYLPMSLGLCLITGWMISRSKKVIQIYALILIVLVFGILVADRNLAWVSEVALWSDSVIKNPNSPRVHNNLGKAYYEEGKLHMARFHLEKSVSSIPEFAKAQFNIENPKNYYERKKLANKTPKGSHILNKKNISIRADFAEPHFNLASVYLDLGQLDDAEAQYRITLKLEPNYYSAELGIGSVKNMKREYDLAIAHFRHSITLMKKATGQSDYDLARLNLGEIYGKTHRYKKSIVELNLAIKSNPSMFLAHYNLGTAYMLTGSYNEAERSLKTCLKIKPNHEPALFNLARVYQKKKEWINSNNMFKEFIKVKGAGLSAYSEMAWNNLMSGNMEQAVTLYEKVLSFKPTNRIALINLAKIYYRLGKYKISRSYIDRALKQSLSQAQSSDLKNLIKKLSSH